VGSMVEASLGILLNNHNRPERRKRKSTFANNDPFR
jgi:hypothetical protein